MTFVPVCILLAFLWRERVAVWVDQRLQDKHQRKFSLSYLLVVLWKGLKSVEPSIFTTVFVRILGSLVACMLTSVTEIIKLRSIFKNSKTKMCFRAFWATLIFFWYPLVKVSPRGSLGCEPAQASTMFYSAIHKAGGFMVHGCSTGLPGIIPVEQKSVHWLSMEAAIQNTLQRLFCTASGCTAALWIALLASSSSVSAKKNSNKLDYSN